MSRRHCRFVRSVPNGLTRHPPSNGSGSVLLECPLVVRPRVPVVPLPPPLRALLAGEVPLLHQTAQRPLNPTHTDLESVLSLQLGSKVTSRQASPGATVGLVQVTALGLLPKHDGNPPQHDRQKQCVEGVSG